ncbi:MAG: flavin reductase family protein [Dehalococcoidia bacterium]
MNATIELEAAAFRSAMAMFASGVTVVTTIDRVSQKSVGFTASAFSSLSLDPPLVLVCLDRKAESHRCFQEARTMAISILAEGQDELALRFAKRGAEKFTGGTTAGPITSCQLVDGAVAQLECEVEHLLPGGDHSIVVGRVLRATVEESERPMVHFNRRFGAFVPLG